MKRYLDDAYTTAFQAKILSCRALPNGRLGAVLDSTYFYPESGGQLSDRGKIADAEVVNVFEDEEGGVLHVVTSPVQGLVSCEVDWNVRFDHMQQHTGQHVLTRAFIEIAGMPTVSFHMGDEVCTIDLEGKGPDDETLDAVEGLANAIIWENRGVHVKSIPVSEIEESTLRKSLPLDITDARLVEVEDFDTVACCGTHVKRTGELGVIKILKEEKVKNNVRIHYKAGKRAFGDYQDKHDVIKVLANRFTTSIDGILGKTDKLTQDVRRLRRELQKGTTKLAAWEKERLLTSARTHGAWRLAVYVCEECDEGYLNLLASVCKDEPNTIVLLGSKGGSVVCAASPGFSIDFASDVVNLAKKAGGSGGGRRDFARVSLPASVNVKEFLEKVYDHVKDVF